MQNDGGGGNLGYMQQGEGQDEEKKENSAIINFETVEDEFVKGTEKEPEIPKEPNFIERIINFIKDLFKPKYEIPKDKDEFLSTKAKKED
jgi:hypothetical protein